MNIPFAIAGALAFLYMAPLTRGMIRLIRRFDYHAISCAALAVMLILVLAVTGWMGLLVMTVATAIGLIPVMFHSRRINCLGVILLPFACSMSGIGAAVARPLGLL